jgi:hypothetical protein
MLAPKTVNSVNLEFLSYILENQFILAQSLNKAYQTSLPDDAILYEEKLKRGDNALNINLTHLLELRIFSRFLDNFLSFAIEDTDIPQEIKNNLIKLTLSKVDSPPEYRGNQQDTPQPRELESYLIVTIHPEEDPTKFLINAWLIEDNQAIANGNLEGFKNLLENQDYQFGVNCRIHEVEQQLNRFLDKALDLLEDKTCRLTLEVFLPKHLMLTAVDRWKITFDKTDDDICFGVDYPLRLRSQERLDPTYRKKYKNLWQQQWNRVMMLLNQNPSLDLFETLEELENINWKKIKLNLENKIGLKLACSPAQAKLNDLFTAILRSATPIAIWTRCDRPNPNCGAIIDQLLCSQPLGQLSESIHRLRKEADAETDDHIGLHLSLLWEDPHRIPPDVNIPLRPPGK